MQESRVMCIHSVAATTCGGLWLAQHPNLHLGTLQTEVPSRHGDTIVPEADDIGSYVQHKMHGVPETGADLQASAGLPTPYSSVSDTVVAGHTCNWDAAGGHQKRLRHTVFTCRGLCY